MKLVLIKILFPLLLVMGTGCVANPLAINFRQQALSSEEEHQTDLANTASGATLKFTSNNFYSLTSPNGFGCAGDAKTYYQPSLLLGNGKPAPFETRYNDSKETIRPSFIKNTSVDLSDGNSTGASNLSYNCSFGSSVGVPDANACARFDLPSVDLANVITGSYSSNYYTVFDNDCYGNGPVNEYDLNTNRALAGGVDIDIDRSKLGPNENVLLTFTYIALGPKNLRPDGTSYTAEDSMHFRVHLMKTGLSGNLLQETFQPRYFEYTDRNRYPISAESLEVITAAHPGVGQKQILLPVSMDPLVDRIRIERLTGTAILVDATVNRMGYR